MGTGESQYPYILATKNRQAPQRKPAVIALFILPGTSTVSVLPPSGAIASLDFLPCPLFLHLLDFIHGILQSEMCVGVKRHADFAVPHEVLERFGVSLQGLASRRMPDRAMLLQ